MTEEFDDDCPPAICRVEQCLEYIISSNTEYVANGQCQKDGVEIDLYINQGVEAKKKVGACYGTITAQLIITVCVDRCSDDDCSPAAVIARKIRNLILQDNHVDKDGVACCFSNLRRDKFERIPARKGDEDIWTDYYTLSFQEN